jgi:hypothetical protein
MQEDLIRFLLIDRFATNDPLFPGWSSLRHATGSNRTVTFVGRRLAHVLCFVCFLALAGCGGVVVRPSAEAAGPNLSINTISVSFGSVALNGSATQPIVFTSTGKLPVKIDALTLSGSGFSISGMSFPVTLNPGQTATLYVQFAPPVVGAATGQLMVSSNSLPDPVLQVALSAAGKAQTGNYLVSLTWAAPSGSSNAIAGYQVYRSTADNAQYQLLNPSIDAQTIFTDSDVLSGTTYQYYVTTVDMAGAQSVPSNIAQVTVP